MANRPQLAFWQIWNMSFGFLGIQFGFALQNANVSRIFQTLGADIDAIPILWIAAPVTGLIVQPLVGYLSDHTWNRFGRRRPYFFWGAVLSTLALFIMPNSSTLWIAAGTLWILDASINISMEPFRAFVGDMLPEHQRTTGFALQSFFIGVGAVIASAMPWVMASYLGIENTAPEGEIPDTVKYSFYLGGSVLLLAVLWTVLSTREYSPRQLAEFNRFENPSTGKSHTPVDRNRSEQQYLHGGGIWLGGGSLCAWGIFVLELDQQLYILTLAAAAFGILQLLISALARHNRTDSGVYQIVNDFFHMPSTMKQLAVVQFFSWFALFSLWIYGTPAVTSFHYGTTDAQSALYNDGANWVGILFAAYNGFAALAALALPAMTRILGSKTTHGVNLSLGGAGLIAFVFIRDPAMLLLPMVGVGIAWASILSMPYAMLSSVLPAHKMGVYMGIFNFFIVIPQILAVSLLGPMVGKLFAGQTIYALVTGGVCLMLAGLATYWVNEGPAQPKNQLAKELV